MFNWVKGQGLGDVILFIYFFIFFPPNYRPQTDSWDTLSKKKKGFGLNSRVGCAFKLISAFAHFFSS